MHLTFFPQEKLNTRVAHIVKSVRKATFQLGA